MNELVQRILAVAERDAKPLGPATRSVAITLTGDYTGGVCYHVVLVEHPGEGRFRQTSRTLCDALAKMLQALTVDRNLVN